MSWTLGLVIAATCLAAIILLLEVIARKIVIKKYPSLTGGKGNTQLRMSPHIFTHFMPSNDFDDVSNHFRKVSKNTDVGDANSIYLSGDCTIFEDHLDFTETVAFQLDALLDDWQVLNAGAPHYTLDHAYHRLVFDITRGYRPRLVVVSSAANDFLSFIHHRNGAVLPSHAHMYRPWLPYGGVGKAIASVPSYGLRLLFGYFALGRRRESWDHFAEDTSESFFELESVRVAREIFDTASYSTSLGLFASACNTINAELVLTTFPYNGPDMIREPRKSYAWGIDRLNETMRKFASTHGIALIDVASEVPFIDGIDIFNKWHFTKEGNVKRASFLQERLNLKNKVEENA